MSTNETALVVIQEGELANLGLSETIVNRCFSLGLRTQDVQALAQLPELYGREATEIVEYLEDGLSLPRVAETLRLQHLNSNVARSTVPVICEALDRVGFSSTDPLGDFQATKDIYHGRAMTSREVERETLRQVTGPNKGPEEAAPSLFQDQQETLIEALAEAGAEIFDDPIQGVLGRIDDGLAGDVLLAYEIMNDSPDRFAAFLHGQIDALALRADMAARLQQLESGYEEPDTDLDLPDDGTVIDDDLGIRLDAEPKVDLTIDTDDTDEED